MARQVNVPAEQFTTYEWSGSTFDYHKKQIRDHLGFRECSVAIADKLAEWLAVNVAHAERDPGTVRAELLKKLREECVEPPTEGRRVAGGGTLPVRGDPRAADRGGRARVLGLVDWREPGAEGDAPPEDDAAAEAQDDPKESVLALIKSMPGNVSLESLKTGRRKLLAARGVGLPPRLFADVAPKVLASWRGRCAVESPSHLRRRSADAACTLLAAYVHERTREITDDLVELLIATVHRIDARAHKKVTEELINAFKRVAPPGQGSRRPPPTAPSSHARGPGGCGMSPGRLRRGRARERLPEHGAGRPGHEPGRLGAGEAGDVGEPDQRLDSDGGADRHSEAMYVDAGVGLAERGQGIFDPADGASLTQRWLLGAGLERQAQRGAQLRFPLDRGAGELPQNQVEPLGRVARRVVGQQ